MNELDLEHDEDLARRIRHTLAVVAESTPTHQRQTPTSLPSPRRARLMFAAAAAVLAVVVASAIVVAGRDAPTSVTNPVPDGPMTPLPAGFDPATATPVFSADGGPDAVAQAFLEARFWDFPRPGVTVTLPELSDTTARARWRSGDDTGTLAEGDLLMRRDGERWVVVAATTNSIDVGSVSFDGTTVSGTVRSTSENSMYADVLDWKGDAVHQSPQPKGAAGAASLMGTAGGPEIGSLELDVRHPGAPAVVRILFVGGTVLGVTEFRLDPPPLQSHADFDGCVKAHTTKEKEPTPDIVDRNCAAALQGALIATGHVAEREWQLVSSEERTGRWVTLRFRDQVGMFRMRADEPAPDRDVREDPVEMVDVCCASSEATVVLALVHHDVGRVRLTTTGGTTVEAETFPGIGRRYAVLVVKPTGEDNEGSLEAQLPNGGWIAAEESFRLAILGG